VLPAHTFTVGPVIVVGEVGTAVKAATERVKAALVPQGPTARTERFPVLYVEPKLKVMLFEVEVPVAPVGSVH
jgi:hypothetical protein